MYSCLECLSATLFDEIFLVCPYILMIYADADSPSGEFVLKAARAHTGHDADADPVTVDLDVSFSLGISRTCPPLSVGSGSRLRELRRGCGKCSPDCWDLFDRNFLASDNWGSVSNLIWQAASDWSSNALLRDLTFRAFIATTFDPLNVVALMAEIQSLVGPLGAPQETCPVERDEAFLHWRLPPSLLRLVTDPDAEPIGECPVGVHWGSIVCSRVCRRSPIAKCVGVAGLSMRLSEFPLLHVRK